MLDARSAGRLVFLKSPKRGQVRLPKTLRHPAALVLRRARILHGIHALTEEAVERLAITLPGLRESLEDRDSGLVVWARVAATRTNLCRIEGGENRGNRLRAPLVATRQTRTGAGSAESAQASVGSVHWRKCHEQRRANYEQAESAEQTFHASPPKDDPSPRRT